MGMVHKKQDRLMVVMACIGWGVVLGLAVGIVVWISVAVWS
jgi:hypothetical protein